MPLLTALLALATPLAPVQAGGVHPLMNTDPAVLMAAYERGRQTALKNRKLSSKDFLRKWSMDIAKAPKAQKGWTAPYIILFVPMATCENWGFNDVHGAKSPEIFRKALPELVAPGGSFHERFTIAALLYAYPGFNAFGDVRREAKRADVLDVKFWLGGEDAKWDNTGGAGKIVDTSTGDYKTKSTRTEYDTVYTPSGPGTVATDVTTTTRYPTFSAQHILKFDNSPANGTPVILPTTRKIVLKVIRNEFVRSVDIDLNRFLKNIPRVSAR